MIGVLRDTLAIVLIGFGIHYTAEHYYGKRLNTAMRRCDCVCRFVDGPWAMEDLRILLHAGESLPSRFEAIVCLDPYELAVDARFANLQQQLDAFYYARLAAEDR